MRGLVQFRSHSSASSESGSGRASSCSSPASFRSRDNQAVRSIISQAVAEYEKSCAEVMRQPLHVGISNYLRLMPNFLPMTALIAGQNPYSADILPPLASAFAYERKSVRGVTPTVQVLAQFICLHSELSLSDMVSLLSCSYLLLEVGVFALNVHPTQVTSAAEKIRLESAFIELCRSLVYASAIMKQSHVELFGLGDVANSALLSLRSSLPVIGRVTASVRLDRLMHPVFVARRVTRQSTRGEMNYLPESDSVCDTIALLFPTHEVLSKTSSHESRGGWTAYKQAELRMIGNPSKLARCLEKAAGRSLGELCRQFIERTRKIVDMNRGAKFSSGSEEASRDRANIRVEAETSNWSSFASEGRTKLGSLIRNVDKRSKELTEKVSKLVNDCNEKLGNVEPVDSESITSLVDSLDRLNTAMYETCSFNMQFIPSLIESEPALNLTGTTVTPFVTPREARTFHIDIGLESSEPTNSKARQSTDDLHKSSLFVPTFDEEPASPRTHETSAAVARDSASPTVAEHLSDNDGIDQASTHHHGLHSAEQAYDDDSLSDAWVPDEAFGLSRNVGPFGQVEQVIKHKEAVGLSDFMKQTQQQSQHFHQQLSRFQTAQWMQESTHLTATPLHFEALVAPLKAPPLHHASFSTLIKPPQSRGRVFNPMHDDDEEADTDAASVTSGLSRTSSRVFVPRDDF